MGDWNERSTLRGHNNRVERCAISPDARLIVSASWDKTLKIWDSRTGHELGTLVGHADRVTGCAFSPDGLFIASSSVDRTLRIWDATSGNEVATLVTPGDVFCVALHPYRPEAVCGDAGGGVYSVELIGIDYGPIVVMRPG